MRKVRILAFVLSLLFAHALVAATGAITWYKFSKKFIADHYASDSGLGTVTATQWSPAGSPHSISCSGNDGELHIGIPESAIQTTGTHPISANAESNQDDPTWGMVAELPNANDGGWDELQAIEGSPVTFSGYFRLWDEGHAHGRAAASNPHHVFELHPAWAFGTDPSNFSWNGPELVRSIPGYSGYGASKFKPILQTLQSGDWLNVWQDADFVYVQLRESPNFHQLPVEIGQIRSITGGHEVVVKVFSDRQFSHLIYGNLRAITANGSPFDDEVSNLTQGTHVYLLGFFSVNLQKAVQLSANANSHDSAVATPDALEFFVFGRALQSAVTSCSSH